MNDTLRRLQLTQLEILNVIDAFCRKEEIHYSLYAGTLLGAVRHHGFIPWDDDLDICMERSEYERFIRAWSIEKPEGYVLQNKNNTPAFSQSFTKIRKEHTTFLESEWERGRYHTGIFVDVFPIDRMPHTRIKWLIFQWKCMRYQLLNREYIPKNASGIVRWISKVILLSVPRERRSQKRQKDLEYLMSFTDSKLPRVAIETMATMRVPLPPNLTDHFTECEFEGGNYSVFEEWDEYLKRKFGDYMTPPPKRERLWRHHPVLIDFEHDLDELNNGKV